jgi:fructosamine-3-kinase
MPEPTYTKHNPGRPGDWEVAGLSWLAAVDGGARIVRVLGRDGGDTSLERVSQTAPDAAHAEEFGRRLAVTHRAGAEAFGAGPDGWSGDGYVGPNEAMLDFPLTASPTWGTFFASCAIGPLAEAAAERGRPVAGTEQLCDRLTAGDFDDGLPPARIHGDLWSGNVLWGPDGVVLIDPVAHGGHRLTDLAGLTMFGAPYLDHILGAYEEVGDLPDGWRDLLPLHRLHMLYLHAAVFGGGYVAETERTVAACLSL